MPSMSNEIVQPTESDLRRSASVEGGKAAKPPALDTSSCTFIQVLELSQDLPFNYMRRQKE